LPCWPFSNGANGCKGVRSTFYTFRAGLIYNHPLLYKRGCVLKNVECRSDPDPITVLFWVVLVLTLGACAAAPLKGNATLLDFLMDGKTSRAEVLTTLGQPSGRFENDQILTYRLGFEAKNSGYYVVEREVMPTATWPTWMQAKYSLVLVFDDTGVLSKHSLVKVN